MILTLFKVISFISIFIFIQGAILPWTISNNVMPLWADIILLNLILLIWLAVVDRMAFHVLKILRSKDEAID